MITRLTALALCLAAGSAPGAPKAYLASPDGNLYELDGSFAPVVVGAPGGTPLAIGATRDHLVTVNDAGTVSRTDPATGAAFAHYQVWHGIAGSAIATSGDRVFVADGSGNISYLDENGDEVNTYYAGLQVSAMVTDGDELVIGSPNTFILTAPFGSANFQFISACGGIVSSLALTGEHLFAGDANGTVYRFAAEGGAYETTFPTATDARGVGVLGGELLVVGSGGTLEQLDPATGAVLGSHDLGISVSGLVVANLCPADLAADGTLDTDDIDAFVSSFVAADLSAADCDASGLLNVDDVDCFAASFLAGCP